MWRLLLPLLVIGLAYLVAYPQPQLDWDGFVLPLARQYAKNAHKEHFSQEQPLQDMVVVVTGATSGIGLGLSRLLHSLGAKVVAVGRSPRKLTNLFQTTNVTTILADYKDFDSVHKAARQIQQQFDHIDILINNVGIHEGIDFFSKNSNHQGFDSVFSVNYMSHFIFTENLIHRLKQSKKPTIVQMASTFHLAGEWKDLVNLDSNEPPMASLPGGGQPVLPFFRTQRGYANSKLANVLHGRSLQHHYPDIRVVSICPAWVATQIAAQEGEWLHSLMNQLAFPSHGYGLASTVLGMFDNNSATTSDYYTNAKVMHLPSFCLSFLDATNIFGIRDVLVATMAYVSIGVQKFVATPQASMTLPIANNETIQEELYQWTYKALKDWL